jgi:hypothetical protein
MKTASFFLASVLVLLTFLAAIAIIVSAFIFIELKTDLLSSYNDDLKGRSGIHTINPCKKHPAANTAGAANADFLLWELQGSRKSQII